MDSAVPGLSQGRDGEEVEGKVTLEYEDIH